MATQQIRKEQLDSAIRSKVITATRDLTAASGDVSYTGVGFRPTKITALAAVDNTQQYSHGFSDSNGANWCLLRSVSTGKYLLEYLIFIDVSSGNTQTAIVKTYDSDGFTLTWVKTNSPTGTTKLSFLCER